MKQYNLLRPVALNELIIGMQILFVSNQKDRREQLETVIALANEQGYFVTQGKTGTYYIVPVACYYHNPLAWIEDKPVYNNDTLYRSLTNSTQECIVDYIFMENMESYIRFTGDTGTEYTDNRRGNLTWTKPKQKKQGWINIYPLKDELMRRYDSKQDALYGKGSQCINTIQIEWEE